MSSSAAPRRPLVDIDRIAARIAAGQHGLVTRDQLLDAGVSRRRIRSRVRSGRLLPLHRDVYLVGAVAPTHAIPLAACLTCGPGAVVSHRSAAVLWEMIPAGSDAAPVDVTVVGGSVVRERVTVHRSRTLLDSERTRLNGVPVTRPTRTLLDLAVVASAGSLERAVGNALAHGLTTGPRLVGCLETHMRRPGSARLRAVLDLGAPYTTRSEAEERFLDLVRRARMPKPRINTRIGPYEVDVCWPEFRLVVEVDGYGPHHSRRAFERDRRRDAYLVSQGYSVVRVTCREMEERPEAIAFQLGRAMALRT